MIRNFVYSFIIFVAFSVSSVSVASAEEYEGYYSSEMIMNFQGKPGDVVTDTIRFFNDTPSGANASFSMKDFIYENNTVIYEEDRPISFSVQKWSTLNVDDVEVESKGYVDIKVTVKISEEAEMGEHMALLEGAFLPSESADSQMKIATEIAPVVYVVVTDKTGNINLNKEWNLLGFKKDSLNGGHFTFTVENTGNVHLESQGSMKIKNLLSGKVVESKIPRVNLLPKNKKDILISWEKKELFGVYKADILFSMDGERFEKQEVTLFVIPWFLLGVIVSSLAVLIISIRMYLKRLKRKWLAEAANASQSTKISS